MNNLFKKLILLIFIIIFSFKCKNSRIHNNKIKKFKLGTSITDKIYISTGESISKMINKEAKKLDFNFNIIVKKTSGSLSNLSGLFDKSLDLGLIQSDIQYKAYKGLSEWKNKPHSNLRSIFSLYPEIINLIVKIDSEINNIQEIKGHRINIGPIGSRIYHNATNLLKNEGFDLKKDIYIEYSKINNITKLLKSNFIDAFFYISGHPSENLLKITHEMKNIMLILPITIKKKFFKSYPYYTKAKTPIKYYPELINKINIKSFGLKTTLCTRVSVDINIIYTLTKTIFEKLKIFKRLHPAYNVLTKKNMLTQLGAPIHKGALKYYKEAGLDKFINKTK